MLTKNQIAALDYQRHLSVTANAGAGKTTVLVQRFIEIVLNTETRVGEVAAITFTEKAASELKKKIADELEKRISEETVIARLVPMERIRDQLVAANIGTIHSFCAQLLREFPVEAEVDASFVILDGIDRQMLERETFRETLESVLTEDDGAGRKEKLIRLLRMFGRETIERYLRIFLLKRDQIDRMMRQPSFILSEENDEIILKQWTEMFEDTILRTLRESEWRNWVTTILDNSGSKEAASVQMLLKKFTQQYTPAQIIETYRELHDALFTTKGTLRKKLTGNLDDDQRYIGIVRQLEQFATSISRLLDGTGEESRNGNRILLSVLRTLLDIYTLVLDRYAKKKSDHGYVDFDDILSKTNLLLSNPSIAPVVINKFKYIMVDEFQDTNHLQYEIVHKLVHQFDAGNLFIVGDPKQSIYGFRDAEVAVFESVRRTIAKHPNGRDITLAESFRPLPNLIDFVNRVFSDLMKASDSGFGVGYNPLVQGRQNSTDGLVEVLLVEPDESRNGRDSLREECILIAARIRKLISDSHTIYSGKGEKPRPVRYSDIAILVRQRTHVRMLESILGDYQIPAVLSGGIGFFQTQEIHDFLNYFTFLLNNDDDVALAGILRSPFFSVPDSELFAVSCANGKSLWEKVSRYLMTSSGSSPVHHAYSILNQHRKMTDRIPIPSLIQSIYTETGWQGTVINLPMGEQYTANAEKLLQIARDFEDQGFSTLYDFIQRLQILVEYTDREGQAPLDLKGNCVQVMTIHAAKGLEFPIVILPFIHESFHYDDPPYIDPELGIALNVIDENNFETAITPSYLFLLRERNRQKTEAEEKRIFYVACTRARDGLILSGQTGRYSLTPTYLRWINDPLSVVSEKRESGPKIFPPSILNILHQNDTGNTISETQHSLTVEVRFNVEGVTIPTVQQRIPDTLPDTINLESIHAPLKSEIFSATQMKTFGDCPRKYYLKYILGVPELAHMPIQYHEEDEADDLLRGELEGAIAHAVLQSLSGPLSDEETIRNKIIDVYRIKGISLTEERSGSVDLLSGLIKSFMISDFGRHILSAPEYHAEYTISLQFNSDILTGTIDRMFKTGDGKWAIVDYKTDNITAENMTQRAKSYQAQLLFYALLVGKLYNQDRVEGSIVFLRHSSKPVYYSFGQDEIAKFQVSLMEWISSIKERTFIPNISHCRFCAYFVEDSCILN